MAIMSQKLVLQKLILPKINSLNVYQVAITKKLLLQKD